METPRVRRQFLIFSIAPLPSDGGVKIEGMLLSGFPIDRESMLVPEAGRSRPQASACDEFEGSYPIDFSVSTTSKKELG